MPELTGRPGPVGRVAIVVSRYHERVTTRLLDGARRCCAQAGVDDGRIDVLWVPGAFELGVAVSAAARTGRYDCIVALGAVVRGETPHFEYVAGETSRVLAEVAREHALPVGFGLLTTETLEQAMERAGGSAGNKGYEAAEAALTTADLLSRILAPRWTEKAVRAEAAEVAEEAERLARGEDE
jgi:6,7-dimethyl-8-ribityllumazine synthase